MNTPRRRDFALSRCMHLPEDLEELGQEVMLINRYHATEGQHPLRAWEYAMAHRAITVWRENGQPADGHLDAPLRACDVGGAGSLFPVTLKMEVAKDVDVVDPNLPLGNAVDPSGVRLIQQDVFDYASTATHDQYDILTAISVLEHVEEPRRFLRACRMLLRSGGLIVLTVDTWNCSGKDLAHYHWMRKRIYNPDTIRKLQEDMRELGFASFGKGDWSYPGNYVFDYTFASLVMVKK